MKNYQKVSNTITWFMAYIVSLVFIPFTLVLGIIFTLVFWSVFYFVMNEKVLVEKDELTQEQKDIISRVGDDHYESIVLMLTWYDTKELAKWCVDNYNWTEKDATDIVNAIDAQLNCSQPSLERGAKM